MHDYKINGEMQLLIEKPIKLQRLTAQFKDSLNMVCMVNHDTESEQYI